MRLTAPRTMLNSKTRTESIAVQTRRTTNEGSSSMNATPRASIQPSDRANPFTRTLRRHLVGLATAGLLSLAVASGAAADDDDVPASVTLTAGNGGAAVSTALGGAAFVGPVNGGDVNLGFDVGDTTGGDAYDTGYDWYYDGSDWYYGPTTAGGGAWANLYAGNISNGTFVSAYAGAGAFAGANGGNQNLVDVEVATAGDATDPAALAIDAAVGNGGNASALALGGVAVVESVNGGDISFDIVVDDTTGGDASDWGWGYDDGYGDGYDATYGGSASVNVGLGNISNDTYVSANAGAGSFANANGGAYNEVAIDATLAADAGDEFDLTAEVGNGGEADSFAVGGTAVVGPVEGGDLNLNLAVGDTTGGDAYDGGYGDDSGYVSGGSASVNLSIGDIRTTTAVSASADAYASSSANGGNGNVVSITTATETDDEPQS